MLSFTDLPHAVSQKKGRKTQFLPNLANFTSEMPSSRGRFKGKVQDLKGYLFPDQY